MAAYPELNSYYQDIWDKLFTSFSKELLYLQSQNSEFGKSNKQTNKQTNKQKKTKKNKKKTKKKKKKNKKKKKKKKKRNI